MFTAKKGKSFKKIKSFKNISLKYPMIYVQCYLHKMYGKHRGMNDSNILNTIIKYVHLSLSEKKTTHIYTHTMCAHNINGVQHTQKRKKRKRVHLTHPHWNSKRGVKNYHCPQCVQRTGE